jgi:hypothetical protein
MLVMFEVFYQAGTFAGLTSSMRCLVPIRSDERMRTDMPLWPTVAYWRRVAEGVSVDLEGREERLAIGSFWKGNVDVPSIIDCTLDGPTPEHQQRAQIAVESLKRCGGIVLIAHSQLPGMFEDAVDRMKADLVRLGRRLEDIPVVVQANFQDVEDSLLPADLGALVGIPAHLCVPSVANKCIGVRETLSLLLREIRSRTASTRG